MDVVDRRTGRVVRHITAAGRLLAVVRNHVSWLGGGCPHYCRLYDEQQRSGHRHIVAILDSPTLWSVQGAVGAGGTGVGDPRLALAGRLVVASGAGPAPVLLSVSLAEPDLRVLRLPAGVRPEVVAWSDSERVVAAALRSGGQRALLAWRLSDGAVATRALGSGRVTVLAPT